MRLFILVLLAMIAFAGNSLLCRLALRNTPIDPATFTTIRIVSGAITLWLIVRVRASATTGTGNWISATALFAYAIAFSFAYTQLSAGTGALLLFGAVQATMIGYGYGKGERLHVAQTAGLLLAIAGLGVLLFPGISAPSPTGSLLMLSAGIAWGAYSLRGRGGGDATQTTAGNFLRAVPLAIALSIVTLPWASPDVPGAIYAIASGALASGIGYTIWYTALPQLRALQAATVQLSVPVLAAIGGIAFLGEQITWRLVIAATAILGGIALVIFSRRRTS